MLCQRCTVTSCCQSGWYLSVRETAVYWSCLPLKAAMCIWIIILQTNKPYPSSYSCFFFPFITFFRRILLLLLPSSCHIPCSSFPALFLYLFFSYCHVPSLAVVKMCDNAVNWSQIPFPAPIFHSLCCLPRSFGTYQIGGRGVEAEVSRHEVNATLTLPISVHL